MIIVVDLWEVTLKEHIDYKEAQRDEVVPPAGGKKLDLTKACKHHVAAKHVKLFLLNMLGGSLEKYI